MTSTARRLTQRPRGPLFGIRVLAGQLRVGKPREPFVELELREDAKKGDKLVLTERDVSFINDSIVIDRAMGRVKTPAPPTLREIMTKLTAGGTR
jgi:hypothetical protein